MLANVIDVTDRCRHSLMCRHVCPIGNITRVETLTPHGWAQLIALERRGLSSWNAHTVDALYKCADCGNCRSHCVYSNPLPEGIAAARAVVAGHGIAPRIVYEIGELLQQWHNPYERTPPEPAQGKGDVALFLGDEAHFLRPALVDAALTLLRAVDVEPVLIGRGRNSGVLASSLGLPAIATELARANLAELRASGARRLLVLSPGEFFAFTQMYDERLGLALPRAVEVTQVVALLAEQLDGGRLRLNRLDDPTPYAYVDPTHAVRAPACLDAPRKLLRALLPDGPRELFWRDGRAYPAGDVALQFTHPELADALTRARLSDAAGAGAQGVITYSPGTLVQLERHAAAYDLSVHGLYELLADRLANANLERAYQLS
jgi:Fe-S oxidoreductase